MTRTGRPRGFDEEQVVHGAKEAFWRQGYGAMSLRQLAKEIDVLPGSLHSAVGNKHTLFLRALRDYVNDTTVAAARLSTAESPVAAIGALMAGVLESAADAPGRGCMLGNSATELLPGDEPTRELVQQGLRALEDGLEKALHEAQRLGEVRDDLDCAASATLLLTLVQGLHVTARAETDPLRLRAAIDTALAQMTPPRTTTT